VDQNQGSLYPVLVGPQCGRCAEERESEEKRKSTTKRKIYSGWAVTSLTAGQVDLPLEIKNSKCEKRYRGKNLVGWLKKRYCPEEKERGGR